MLIPYILEKWQKKTSHQCFVFCARSWVNKDESGILIWATSWQNQQNGICAQRRLRSARASAQSDQRLRCLHDESLGPSLPIEQTVKTDQTGRMPRLTWVFAGRTVILVVLLSDGSYCVISCAFQNVLYESPAVTAINESVIPFSPVQLPHPPRTTTLFNPRRQRHVSGLKSLPRSRWSVLFLIVLTSKKLNRKDYSL